MQSNLLYRRVKAEDWSGLKALHTELFPIDYEDSFFNKVCNNEDRIFSFAAVQQVCIQQQVQQHWQQQPQQPQQEWMSPHCVAEELVGFITARLVHVHECDHADRQYMGISSRSLDGQTAVYILTLGVAAGCRKRGVAMHLLKLAHQQAASMGCYMLFLHVISYNQAALRLYSRAGFLCAGHLRNFYYINSGRQPDPNRQHYDALLYALPLMGTSLAAAPGPTFSGIAWPFSSCWGSSPGMQQQQWLGPLAWGVSAATAPLRHALGSFEACLPWHREYAHRQATASAAGVGSIHVEESAESSSSSRAAPHDTARCTRPGFGGQLLPEPSGASFGSTCGSQQAGLDPPHHAAQQQHMPGPSAYQPGPITLLQQLFRPH